MNILDRPDNASPESMTRKLRLHRREWRHDQRTYQVISLRPGDRFRYAVDPRYGRLTMIWSDLAGVRLLGRLLWGLSYQRRPDTLLVLDPNHLATHPEHGRPSLGVVFAVAGRTVLPRSLAGRVTDPALWRTAPTGTVTWNTAGLPTAMEDLRRRQEDRRRGLPIPDEYHPCPAAPLIKDCGPGVVIAAVPERLRQWATSMVDVGGFWYRGEACAEPEYEHAFDVHAVRHFDSRTAAAARARARIRTDPDRSVTPRDVDEHVADQLTQATHSSGFSDSQVAGRR